MAKRIKFSDLLPIYRAMVREQGSKFSLVVSNDIIKDALCLALDESNIEESGVSVVHGDYQNIKLGDEFSLSIESPRVGLGILADDFKGYLSSAGTKVKERKFYYLIGDEFSSTDDRELVVVSRYREVLRLISFLGEAAHYLDPAKEELVFYKEGRFVVPILYSEDDLKKFSLPAFSSLERMLGDSLHKDQKIKILGESMVEMLSSVAPKERFSYTLAHLEEIYNRVLSGYNIFASDFTYEKAVAEVHAFKVDIITKIHKAITDIQAQVLGIPVATFVAVSQLKKTTALDAQLAANTVIFCGVIIFCLLLIGFLVNQKATLDTIGGEIDRQRNVFEKKFHDNKQAYSVEFDKIDARLFVQYCALYGIAVLDALMLAGSFVYYVVYTRPVFDVLFG